MLKFRTNSVMSYLFQLKSNTSHNFIQSEYKTLGLSNIKDEIQTCISKVACH